MNLSRLALPGLVAAALPLAACTVRDGNNAANAETADAAAPTANAGTSGVTLENVAAPAAPPPAAIATQQGSDGISVALTRLAVTGDIMTATFTCTSAERYNGESFKIDEISVIDDATAQRIGVLKDDAGTPLASPLNATKKEIRGECGSTGGVIWAKFPAPPATSPTVSITLPGVAPFDGVTVTR